MSDTPKPFWRLDHHDHDRRNENPASLSHCAGHVVDCMGTRFMRVDVWPVVSLASSHPEWYAEATMLVADLSAAERAQVSRGSTQHFYGLVTP